MKKKTMITALAAVLCVSLLAACGDSTDTDTTTTESSVSTSEAAETVETEETESFGDEEAAEDSQLDAVASAEEETSASAEEEPAEDLTDETEAETETAEFRVVQVSAMDDQSLTLTVYALYDDAAAEQETAEAEDAADTADEAPAETETVADEGEQSLEAEDETGAQEEAPEETDEAFDAAGVDLSLYAATEEVETFLLEDAAVIYRVEDGALVEATAEDITVGAMLVIFQQEDGTTCLAVYPTTLEA